MPPRQRLMAVIINGNTTTDIMDHGRDIGCPSRSAAGRTNSRPLKLKEPARCRKVPGGFVELARLSCSAFGRPPESSNRFPAEKAGKAWVVGMSPAKPG